ncbi:MAG: hypothetical protein HFH53_07230 [Hespellia sp.]|jgi:hypothetical protein|nr:hypothetical protein [Hespellia sp.]
MASTSFIPIVGLIRDIQDMSEDCCSQMITIVSPEQEAHFVISPDTDVIDSIPLRRGMQVAAFYDANVPVPLIFPPQYQAVLITRLEWGESVMLSRFNQDLVSEQNTLQLNVARNTRITTVNGQRFRCPLENRELLVYYSATTRSIPPQTTPRRIVVMC